YARARPRFCLLQCFVFAINFWAFRCRSAGGVAGAIFYWVLVTKCTHPTTARTKPRSTASPVLNRLATTFAGQLSRGHDGDLRRGARRRGGVLRACARSIKCDMVLAMPCSPRPRPGLSFSRLSGGCRGLDLGEGRTPCGFVGKVDQCSTPAFLRNQLAR